MLSGGTMARAKVERVIGVYAVSDGGKTTPLRQIVKHGKELVFAEIASVGGGGAVGGIIHFVRFDEFVAQAQFAYEFFYDGAIVGGVTRRERGNGEGAGAQRFVSCPGQVGRVRATGERGDERWDFGQTGEQKIFFFFRGLCGAL